MADQRHRTILEIGVDDRQLRNAGKTLDSAFSAKAMEAFEKSLERTAALMAKIAESQEKIARGQEKMSRAQGQASQGGLAARLFARAMGTTDRDTVERLARAGWAGDYGARGRMVGGAYLGGAAAASGTNRAATLAGQYGGMMMNEGFVGSMLAGIPYVGPIFGGAASAAGGYYQSHVARSRARAGAYGSTYLGKGEYSGIPDDFGLGPQGLPAALAELGRASGLRGSDLAERFPMAAALQNLMGIGYGEQGAFIRAARGVGLGGTGREVGEESTVVAGETDTTRMRRRGREPGGPSQSRLRELLGTAIANGVDTSDLGRVVSDIGSAVVSMNEQGIYVDPASITSLAAALGDVAGERTGLGGMAGFRLAQSMGEGLRGVARNPQDDLFQMMAMEAAGFGSGATYMQARERLQTDPESIVPTLLERMQGMVSDPNDPRQREALANMIERVFSSIGVSMSIRQAMSLAGADTTEFRRDYLEGPRANAGTFDEEYAALMREGFPLYGTAREEAAYENRRANLGGKIADEYRNIRNAELSVVTELLPSVMGVMSSLVDVGRELAEAFSRDGLRGVFQELADIIRSTVFGTGPATPPAAPAGGVPALPPGHEPAPGPGRRS